MNRDIGDPKASRDDHEVDDDLDDETEDSDESDDTTIVLDETGALTDNVGDVSVEINVEELIAELEACDYKDAARRKEIRRRLEDLAEEKASLEDTYALDFGEESD